MNYLFDYGSIITYTENKKIYTNRSICYPPQFPLKSSMLKTEIKQNENYRPDKISYRLFGDPTLSWILDDINSFYKFSEYYAGREIYYLNSAGLTSIFVDVDYVSYETQNY